MSRVALVFSAQGGRGAFAQPALLEDQSVFLDSIVACDDIVRRRLGWSVVDQLKEPRAAPDGSYHSRVQPLLTSVQIALSNFLVEQGVNVAAVSGLSMGEAAAFHTAGIYELAGTLEVVCAQSELASQAGSLGKMVLVQGSSATLVDQLENLGNSVFVAVRLSPTAAVVAGRQAAIGEFLEQPAASDIDRRVVNIGVAYHTPIVAHLEEAFRRLMRPIQTRSAQIPVYSSVTGLPLSADEITESHDYWWKIFSVPGRFDSMVRSLVNDGYRNFVEVAPNANLARFIEENCRHREIEAKVTHLGSVDGGPDELRRTIDSLFA